MNDSPENNFLLARLKDIQASIEKLEAKIAVLQAEQAEINIAQNVIDRLSGAKKKDLKLPLSHKKKRIRPKGKERPEGIPTTPEMMRLAIIAANKEGKVGLSGQELYEVIGKQWWPGVDPNLIKPTAWRLEKEGRLGKIGDKYTLPKVGNDDEFLDLDDLEYDDLVSH